MKKDTIELIAVNAVIAAVYVALTLAIAPLSYMALQFRVSEILIFLAYYNKKYLPGLILGCFIANLFSPMLLYDVTFGTLATVIAVVCISIVGKLLKRHPAGLFTVPVIGAVPNGLLVGLELYLAFQEPFLVSAGTVALGEFLTLLAGAVVFFALDRILEVRRRLLWETSEGKRLSKR